jgi:orotidine-5'-phosphate decarboxylase
VTTPIIVALDYPQAPAALDLAQRLSPALCRLKVGKELFTSSGPALVEKLQQMGFEVFLDLKFHDIPNTVAGAVRAAAELGVWMVNVHACGGRRMMMAAAEAIAAYSQRPLLIGVTVLTSMSDEDLLELGYSESAHERVMRLANLAADSGLDGVVCSAQEATALRQAQGSEFCLVIPQISAGWLLPRMRRLWGLITWSLAAQSRPPPIRCRHCNTFTGSFDQPRNIKCGRADPLMPNHC